MKLLVLPKANLLLFIRHKFSLGVHPVFLSLVVPWQACLYSLYEDQPRKSLGAVDFSLCMWDLPQ